MIIIFWICDFVLYTNFYSSRQARMDEVQTKTSDFQVMTMANLPLQLHFFMIEVSQIGNPPTEDTLYIV
jgi:hypothetical protein